MHQYNTCGCADTERSRVGAGTGEGELRLVGNCSNHSFTFPDVILKSVQPFTLEPSFSPLSK